MKLNSRVLPSKLQLFAILFVGIVSANTVEEKIPVTPNKASVSPSKASIMGVNAVIKTVTDDVSELGEGPYWDSVNRILYYVDSTTGDYKRLDPTTRAVTKISQGVLVSIIIPYADEPDTFVVTRRHQVLKLNWNTQNTTVLATVRPDLEGLERFNDAKCDPRGRLFIGSVLERPGGGVFNNSGSLYRLDGDKFTPMATGFSISNGMAWSNDVNHTKLYFNDSEGRKIYTFDYNIENGTLSNQRVMIDCDNNPDFVADEFPDGMLIDKFGFIWVAMWNGGRIVKIDTEIGRVVDDVKLPRVKIPSSLAPGEYEGRDGFFVTTASIGIPENQRLDDGKILHISFEGGDVYKFKP